MRHTKTNESQRRKNADSIRKMELEQMAEHEPSESAKRQMQHKPYQAAKLIEIQGKQMEHESVIEYIVRKYGVKGEVVGGNNKRTVDGIS